MKPKRKYAVGFHFEARRGQEGYCDPNYPIKVYAVWDGDLQFAKRVNAYVSVEAAREDFPNVRVIPPPANFIEDLRCPNCGSDEYDEGDCKDFGDEERRSFVCKKCETHWFQWERIERIPCRIEYEAVEYDLPESEADRIQKAAPKLLEAARKALDSPALNMDDLEPADVEAAECLRNALALVKPPTKST